MNEKRREASQDIVQKILNGWVITKSDREPHYGSISIELKWDMPGNCSTFAWTILRSGDGEIPRSVFKNPGYGIQIISDLAHIPDQAGQEVP